jgi:aminoglycoside/choline kinase family phosphotransferase
MNDKALAGWLDRAVAGCWHGARPASSQPIRGDASGRRFWRVNLEDPSSRAPSSVIAVDLGAEDTPAYVRALGLLDTPLAEPPFVSLQRFFESIGVAVPKIYAFSSAERLLLIEDVGPTALFDAASNATPHDAAVLYRAAIDQLLVIHWEGTRKIDRDCVAAQIAYDERLFRWELEQFLDLGLPMVAPRAEVTPIRGELDRIAAILGGLPRVLSHRDYHGHNLHVQNGAIRVIDFQDALMAPATQDLSVLLTTRQTTRVITPAIERRLLDYYLGGLARRGFQLPSKDDFEAAYRMCVLQHALKVIGRFAWLEKEGRRGYLRFIPYALANARRMLAGASDLDALKRALKG